MTGIISFIILHYVAIEETIICVDSIKKMQMQDQIKIVIVDNASPNNSGIELQKKYRNDSQVHIILNEENGGFSRGNNIGCEYAKTTWNPKFYVVTNNDVIFEQKDFCERVFSEYEKEKFHVLGMDIFCPKKDIHQSPLAKNIPDIKSVNRTIFINNIMLKFFDILFLFIKFYYNKIDQSGNNAIDYDKYQENICVMGACMVFSQDYMRVRRKPFEPETGFYYEEFLVTLWCIRNNARIVYQPEIKVIHNEGIATTKLSHQYKEKVRFRIVNIVESASIFRKEIILLEKREE